jgi:hypothetical protein
MKIQLGFETYTGGVVGRFWLIGLALFIFHALLSAQERFDTALFIAPTTGGTPEDRRFFDEYIPMEVENAGYKLVGAAEASDYIINLDVSADEDYYNPDNPDETGSLFGIQVVRTRDSVEIIRFAWPYQRLNDMFQWNLYLIYNALANVTLTQAGQTPAVTAPPTSLGTLIALVTPPLPWWDSWLSLGFRAAPSFSNYGYQTGTVYLGDNSGGFGVEGGLTVGYHPFRFFGLQLDALITYDGFTAPRVEERETVRVRSVDGFTGLSFTLPLIFKVPLAFEKIILSPYVGTYFTMPIGPMTKISGDTKDSEEIPVFKTLPLGFTAGLELAVRAGPGEVFLDFRYYKDFGETVTHNDHALRYVQDRLTLAVGWRFGILKRGPRSPRSPPPPPQLNQGRRRMENDSPRITLYHCIYANPGKYTGTGTLYYYIGSDIIYS